MAIDYDGCVERGMTADELRQIRAQVERRPYEKKGKQRGRGENQLERDFGLHVEGKPGIRYWSKPFILRIAPATTFEPDAMIAETDGDTLWTWVIDTKGPWVDGDSRLKIKVAAERFPMWRWLIVTRPDGIWRAKEVTAARGIERKFIKRPWL